MEQVAAYLRESVSEFRGKGGGLSTAEYTEWDNQGPCCEVRKQNYF
jgi:hypothetical protein